MAKVEGVKEAWWSERNKSVDALGSLPALGSGGVCHFYQVQMLYDDVVRVYTRRNIDKEDKVKRKLVKGGRA